MGMIKAHVIMQATLSALLLCFSFRLAEKGHLSAPVLKLRGCQGCCVCIGAQAAPEAVLLGPPDQKAYRDWKGLQVCGLRVTGLS